MALYDGFIGKLAERFDRALAEIEAEHSFELGSEFETAICRILRRVLPGKFGVCRGYLVTADGEKAGDDIIIYDRIRFPTLRSLDQNDYSQKEQVPIEAAYAYIEAKHTLHLSGDGPQSVRKALSQVAAVKTLCSKREKVPVFKFGIVDLNLAPYFTPSSPPGYPDYKNPFFAAIFARFIREAKDKPQIEGVTEALDAVNRNTQQVPNPPPDIAVLGRNVVSIPVLESTPGAYVSHSPFLLQGKGQFTVRPCPSASFGVGLALLFWALESIELGRLPWWKIAWDALDLPYS